MLPALPLPAVPRRLVAVLSTLALVVAGLVAGIAPARAAAPSDLIISEYVEGSSFNKAIEIYNGTGAAVTLSAYTIELYSNGAGTPSVSRTLSGTLADGDVFVGAHSAANAAIRSAADDLVNGGVYNWNGDDAIVLRKGSTVVDSIGQVGFDPGTEWGSGLTSTADNTLRRKPTVLAGDTVVNDAFSPAGQWDGFAQDTVDGLGAHTVDPNGDAAPAVTATTPARNAVGVPGGQDLSVTFGEPVDVAPGAFALDCEVAGTQTLTVTGGPTTWTLDPASDLPDNDRCTLTVTASLVTDQDQVDPPDTMAADYVTSFHTSLTCDAPTTPTYEIQGAGNESPLTGEWVITEGVVVGDYEGTSSSTLRGFYLQDSEGDGDAATSDGVFVFNSRTDEVEVGQQVRVTGFVSEFQGQTQVSTTQAPQECGTTGTVAPTAITLPQPSTDYFERYEGMLVAFDQKLAVTETFQLGRFGQVVMSSDERLWQPTQLVEPGAPALAMQAANNLDRVIVDDASQGQNPDPLLFGRGGEPLSADNTLRIGDTAEDVAGVMTYTWAGNAASGNAWRVRPLGSLGGEVPTFEPTNPRPEQPESVGGSLKVASFNVLNYFNTFGSACTLGVGGEVDDCRGANNPDELERQADKIVEALVRLDADVVGLIEIENDGYGPDSAMQDLVDRVNSAVALEDAYQVLDVDYLTGQTNAAGTDAIKVGFIYRPATVSAIGETAVLNTGAFGLYEVQGEDGIEIIGRNRPAVTQTFVEKGTGGRVTVSVNHLKSKGSGCEDNISPVGPDPQLPDGQGNCNLTRAAAAAELADWLAGYPTKIKEADQLVIGDLNSYAKEDPIAALEDGGFTNMIAAEIGEKAYSYVFDGQSGYLDHALASPSLVEQITGVTEWHINADEPTVLDYNLEFKSDDQDLLFYAPDPFRSSDHDPILVGLDLVPQGGRGAR